MTTKRQSVRVIARDGAQKPTRFRQDLDGVSVADLKFDAGKLTQEGYFCGDNVPISRPGLQEYSALELGLDASFKTVRLYRPPEQVFDPESMASADRKPVTYYHPPGAVDASNWREHAVGHVESPTPSEAKDFLTVGKFIVNDGSAIGGMASGTRQISCGYDFALDMTAGMTPAGEAYDGIQKDIRINHVAIVYSGRCGAGCAIGDCACGSPRPTNATQEKTMKINVGGIDIELNDKDAAIVQREIGALTTARDGAAKRATDAETALAAQGEAMKKLATDHAGKVAELEGKILKPEQLDGMLSELATVTADARSVLPEIEIKGKNAHAIRVEALTAVVAGDDALKTLAGKILGGAEPAKAADVLVRAAFDAVVASSGAVGGDAEYQREVADALTGDRRGGAAGAGKQKVSGRALMIARSRGQITAERQ